MATVRRWLGEAWQLVGADLPVFSTAAFLCLASALFSGGLLAFPLWTGLLLMFADKRSGQPPTLRHLAEGISRFPATVGVWAVYLVASVPFVVLSTGVMGWLHTALGWGRGAGWVGLLIQVVGHIVVTTPLLLALPLIADRDVGGMEALRYSWRHSRTFLPRLFVLATVLALMLLLGVFACGLGIILTVPVAAGAQLLAYHELVGEAGNRTRAARDAAPPGGT